jgi:hypothetical protein
MIANNHREGLPSAMVGLSPAGPLRLTDCARFPAVSAAAVGSGGPAAARHCASGARERGAHARRQAAAGLTHARTLQSGDSATALAEQAQQLAAKDRQAREHDGIKFEAAPAHQAARFAEVSRRRARKARRTVPPPPPRHVKGMAVFFKNGNAITKDAHQPGQALLERWAAARRTQRDQRAAPAACAG